MVAAAAIGAVSTAVGAGVQISQGKKAAKAQRQAADQQAQTAADQIAEERRQYDLTRADYAPYREAGYKALDTLSSMYGANPNGKTLDMSQQVMATPGYQFRLGEGIKAAERSAAARGLLGSGATMKAIQRYGEGLASSEYDNYANRLAALAGVGQTATGSTAAAGQAAVAGMGSARNAMGQAAVNAGNARASSYINTADAINGAINNGVGAYLYSQRGGFGGGSGGGFTPPYNPDAISVTPMNKRFF